MQRNELTNRQRQALLLAKTYERERRKCQRGYKLAKTEAAFLESQAFKAFCTVRDWLEQQTVHVAIRDVRLNGYVKYVFEQCKQIPQPGQLKNIVLLKAFIKAAPEKQVRSTTIEKMLDVYSQVLIPEVSSDIQLLRRLGLGRVHKLAAKQPRTVRRSVARGRSQVRDP